MEETFPAGVLTPSQTAAGAGRCLRQECGRAACFQVHGEALLNLAVVWRLPASGGPQPPHPAQALAAGAQGSDPAVHPPPFADHPFFSPQGAEREQHHPDQQERLLGAEAAACPVSPLPRALAWGALAPSAAVSVTGGCCQAWLGLSTAWGRGLTGPGLTQVGLSLGRLVPLKPRLIENWGKRGGEGLLDLSRSQAHCRASAVGNTV